MSETIHAWGDGCWDNDAALELVSRLLESPDATTQLESALRAGSQPGAGLASAARALAAADLAAATRAGAGSGLPEDARELIGLFLVYASDETLQLAETAVKAIGAESSALHRHWAETDARDTWRERVSRLRERLASLQT